MPNQNVSIQRTCDCGNTEIFTYRDWLKHGFQVQRGERGIHTTELRVGHHEKEYEAKVVTFCFCQVESLRSESNLQNSDSLVELAPGEGQGPGGPF